MDVVDQTAAAVDRLIAVLDDVIDVVLHDRPRVAMATAIVSAVMVVDRRLQEIVDSVRDRTHADGVMVVVLDDKKAHIVTMAGNEVVSASLDVVDSAPAEDSYCKYSITMSVPFVVEDAMTEPVLACNPWRELVRGYLGGTLVVSTEAVGALCAVTDGPRQWSPEDETLIHEAAAEVSGILERALATYR